MKTELKSDGKFAFAIPEPVRVNSAADIRAGIDLQPVVFDQSLRLALAPLPATRICLPNRQHIGFTLFGVEIFGVTVEGEANFLVGAPERQTQIIRRPAKAAGIGVRAGKAFGA